MVDALALEFLEKLVPPIDKEDAHASVYQVTDQGILPSLTTVLVQEVWPCTQDDCFAESEWFLRSPKNRPMAQCQKRWRFLAERM